MAKNELCIRGRMELRTVIAYLEDLVASLKAGRVCVEQGEKSIVLQPQPLVTVEIEAEKRGSKESLEIELSWSAAARNGESLSLRISPNVPAPAAGGD